MKLYLIISIFLPAIIFSVKNEKIKEITITEKITL